MNTSFVGWKAYPSSWSVDNFPVREEIYPCNLRRVSDLSPTSCTQSYGDSPENGTAGSDRGYTDEGKVATKDVAATR